MTIATQRSTLYRTLLLLGVASLVACGGGGGSTSNNTGSSTAISVANSIANSVGVSSSSIEATGSSASTVNNVSSSLASSIVATSSSSVAVADTTPAVFNFAPTTDAALSTAITSPAITLSGFDVAVPISITNGEYSINGGAFTSAAGTISPAQTLAVKVTSSNANSTAVTATLTVGGVSATYTVTTLADAIPDAFTFTPATNVEPESPSTSNTITVNGIEVATAISITGGEYSINGGAFTSAAGTVTNGQTVAVKVIAPAGTELTQNSVVTIGGVSGTYAVTTVPDTTPPVAEFKFPTPYTMSEANSVKVRGTAMDEHAISSVKVVVRSFNLDAPEVTLESDEIDVTPAAEIDGIKDFSSWTIEVPLTANAENEIKVVAMDEKNNEIVIDDANKVVIRQADVASAFPDVINQFDWLAGSIALDSQAGRNRLLVSDHDQDRIYAVDMSTGQRSVFIYVDSTVCDNHAEGIVIDPVSQHLYAFCYHDERGILLEYNLADGQFVASYDSGLNDEIYGMALDRTNGRNQLVMVVYKSQYLIPYDDGAVLAFNLATKAFSVISATDQQSKIVEAQHIVVDGDRYLVTTGGYQEDASTHSVIAVDIATGSRSIFSSNAVGEGEIFSGLLPSGWITPLLGAAIQTQYKRLLVNEMASSKLFSIDLISGDRSVFKDLSYVQSGMDTLVVNQDIIIDDAKNIALIDETFRDSILIVDLDTAEKVILSKSINDF